MKKSAFHDWSTSSTEGDALSAMAAVADSLDCHGILLSYSPVGWLPSGEPGTIYRTIQVGVNERLIQNWMARPQDNRLQLSPSSSKFDPLRRRMVKQIMPHCFGLRELMDESGSSLTTTQQRWCKSLLRTGVEAVITMPVQVPPFEYWNLSLLSATTRTGSRSLTGNELAGLMYFAHGLVQFCIRQLRWHEFGRNGQQLNLRPRERDCLYWAAIGKSAAETAYLLGLKTETVRKYLKTALARLNARTKAQAVAKALQWGLLDLANIGPVLHVCDEKQRC